MSRPGADARRFVSYRDGSEVRAGVLVGGLVFDAANLARRSRYATMRGVLSEWDAAQHAFDEALAAGSALQCRSFRLEDITLAAPVPEPGDIFAAGANYDDHIEEMARIMNQPLGPNMKQLGDKPWHFVKTGRSSIVGPGAEVPMPSHSRAVDWEIELAAVIGRPAKDVSVEHALDHVAGYTIANDLSARDVIRREKNPPTSPFHYDWISIKCFDGSCPTGPWIVPRNEISDPQRLALKLWINDEIMQDSNTSKMIFGVAEQVAMLSSRVTLQPGDLVLTGTPAGVGMARGRFLKAGDVVRLWIDGIGTLSHRMT